MYTLESERIDFALAFPQAELKDEIYTETPQGMEVEGADELRQLSHNWYKMIKKGLEEQGFTLSIADSCIF